MQPDGSRKDFTESAGWATAAFEAQGDGAVVYDLRRLRPFCSSKRMQAEHPELCAQVFRFDAVLLLPEFHRSREIVPMRR